MPGREDDWHRLLFRPDMTSTDEEPETQGTDICTCENFDPIGKVTLCTLTLDRTCLISSEVLRNIFLAILDPSKPDEKAFRLPHWIRFDGAPRTVIFVECLNHPDSEMFPLCVKHNFRYTSVGASVFEDLFLTPIRAIGVAKKRKSQRSVMSLHRLREKRRDEEESVIRRVMNDNEFDEEQCELPVSFNYNPQSFETTAYQRRLLGIYLSTDDSIPMDILKPRYRHHEHPPPQTCHYAEIPTSYLISLDCEMVRTTHGFSVARISIVDIPSGKVLYDEFIRPIGHITSYMTQYSGITKLKLKEVNRTLDEARNEILEKVIFEDTIVVGHALHNDLRLLRIAPKHVIDISLLYPKHCMENTSGLQVSKEDKKSISTTLSSAEAKSLGIEGQLRAAATAEVKRGFQLKLLSFWFLGRHIQLRGSHGDTKDIGHDSVEDAHACSDLFRLKMHYGKDFGIDALLYYASGQIVSSANEEMIDPKTFDMRAVISRMRNMKSIDAKYSCTKFREEFRNKEKVKQISMPNFLLEHLNRTDVRFLWSAKGTGEWDILPEKNRIPSLRYLKEFLPKEDRVFIYLNMSKPPSNWNLFELGNYLHEECLDVNPKAPPPLVVMVTMQNHSTSSVLFH